METVTGYVTGINGNLANVSFEGAVHKNEVGYILVDGKRLKGEVIRINNGVASMQIYEMSNGIKVGDQVEFGGLLGYAPIMPVNEFSCDAFVNRGGRIPAPIHSFKN